MGDFTKFSHIYQLIHQLLDRFLVSYPSPMPSCLVVEFPETAQGPLFGLQQCILEATCSVDLSVVYRQCTERLLMTMSFWTESSTISLCYFGLSKNHCLNSLIVSHLC